MKLFIKILILMLVSPYLMFPFAYAGSWYEVHPPIIRQVVETITVTQNPILGKPLRTDRLELCEGAWRDFKSYMDWSAITDHSSQQYKFITTYMDTKSKDGLLHLKVDTKFIGVALGSYFGGIGSKFKFTLAGGEVIYAVKVEEKADIHTMANNCVHAGDSSIIEFVVNGNFKSYYPEAYEAGNLAVLPQFKGEIIQIDIIEG